MRWLITLLLFVLVLVGGVWLVAGNRVRSTLGLTGPDRTVSESFTQIDNDLTPENVRSVTVNVPGHPPLTLTRAADGSWSQPGNWPVRESEAETLVAMLTGLRSRFTPVPLDSNPAEFGLDDLARRVEVVVGLGGDGAAKTLKLVFARPESAESEFARPCYLRVNDNAEVVRLGPDVYPILARSPEVYRRRQLFPDAERVKLGGVEASAGVGGRVAILGDAYQSVKVTRPINYPRDLGRPGLDATGHAIGRGQATDIGKIALKLRPDPETSAPEPKPASELGPLARPDAEPPASAKSKPPVPDAATYTLTRERPTPEPHRDPDRATAEPAVSADQLAAAWSVQIELPGKSVRDRPDPAKLQAALTAVPELWVESFVSPSGATGLDDPARSVTVTRADGKAVTVLFGDVTRRVVKTEAPPPPMFPGAPQPPPRETVEEYRYAKLKDNDLVFEVRTDALNDLFADPRELRDATLARFETDEVTEVTLALQGRAPVTFTKRKGDKLADKEEDRQDRWYVGDVPAEAKAVTDLLDQLRKLEARGESVLDSPTDAKLRELSLADAGSRVTITTRAKVAEGDPAPESRTITLTLGKEPEVGPIDAAASAVGSFHVAVTPRPAPKLPVRVAGWDRVNLLDDSLLNQFERPAVVYRSRKLFDTAEAKLTSVAVTRRGGPGLAGVVGGSEEVGSAFALEQAKTSSEWMLTQPVRAETDAANAGQLADALAKLTATDYVDATLVPGAESARRALGGVAADWAYESTALQRYGLDRPRLAVDVGFTGASAKPRTLAVGEATGDAVYGWLADERVVFTVPKTAVEPLERGAVSLLPTQLWSTATDRVSAVEITRGSAPPYRVVRSGGSWAVAGPFDVAAATDEVQELLDAASTLRVERYDALAADPAKHGLNASSVRLAVTYRSSPTEPAVTKAIRVGKPAGPGQRYAKLDGDTAQAVFVIPDRLAALADRPAEAWLDRTLLTLDRADVAKIDIAGPTPDSNVTLTKVTNVTWKAEGAAFKLDQPTLDALLLAAAARPPVSEVKAYGPNVKWADYGLEPAEYTLTLTLAGEKPRTHTLKLGKKDPDTGGRFVRVDGGPAVGLVPQRAADALARGKLDFIDRTLLEFPRDALESVARKMGADEFELTRGALNWQITKPAKHKADAQTTDDLAGQLAALRAVKVAAVAPADLDKPFGLKTPAATLTLTVGAEKPETKVLRIGNPVDPAKPDGDRYVTASADDSGVTVGVLAAPVANKLLAPPLKFREWTQPRFVDVDKLTLERGDRKVTFAKVAGTWKVTEPTAAEAQHAEIEELIAAVANLRADELVADKPADLKPFGLDKPEAKWTLYFGDRELLGLHVGAKDKDGRRAHAKLAKGDLVALLPVDVTARLLREYRARAVWPESDPMQIESVVISSAGGTFTLNRTATGWGDPAKPGEPIDADRVAETLAVLAAPRAERFVADQAGDLAAYGLDKPKWVLVVTQRGTPPRTLHLGGPSAVNPKQLHAALSDQKAVFLLSEADTQKLTRDRAAYAAQK